MIPVTTTSPLPAEVYGSRINSKPFPGRHHSDTITAGDCPAHDCLLDVGNRRADAPGSAHAAGARRQKSLGGHAVIVGAELARHMTVGRNADKLPNPGQVNREQPVNVRSCRRYIAREILAPEAGAVGSSRIAKQSVERTVAAGTAVDCLLSRASRQNPAQVRP